MRGKNLIAMFRSPKTLLAVLLVVAGFGALAVPVRAFAADLPLAAGSPLTGVSFDDRPLLLPVQRNFQMAMLTASSQIGRSCGRMESYGWRTAQSEQHRVNLIFSNTVDRLRGLGYTIEAQTPNSISKDITLFTADRPDKHFLFMWSAGEIGLVMVLCESSPPLTGRMASVYNASQTPMLPPPQDVLQSRLETPPPSAIKGGRKTFDASTFTPIGDWVGDYTCLRGYTGATMHIDAFKGEDFRGVFRFYPTAKNPFIPKGSYEIYGQYDKQSKRILINPGKWLEHPNGYYKTIVIGSFDPALRTFSGFFQGIMGCTSFEAKSVSHNVEVAAEKTPPKHAKPKKKKPVAKAAATSAIAAPAASDNIPPVTGDITLGTSKPTPPAPAAAKPAAAPQPVAPAPAVPAPVSAVPSPTPISAVSVPAAPAVKPVPAPQSAAPVSAVPAPAPVSAVSVPAAPAAMATPPAPVSIPPAASPTHPAVPATAPVPSPATSSSMPMPLSAPPPASQATPTVSPVVPQTAPVASAPVPLVPPTPHPVPAPQPVPPSPPQTSPAAPTTPPATVPTPSSTSVPQPTSSLAPKAGPHAIVLAGDWPGTPGPPELPPAPVYNTTVPRLPPAPVYNTNVPQLPLTSNYNVNAPQLPLASNYDVNPPQLPLAQEYDVNPPQLPQAASYDTNVSQLPPAEIYDTNVPQLPTAESYSIMRAPGS